MDPCCASCRGGGWGGGGGGGLVGRDGGREWSCERSVVGLYVCPLIREPDLAGRYLNAQYLPKFITNTVRVVVAVARVSCEVQGGPLHWCEWVFVKG